MEEDASSFPRSQNSGIIHATDEEQRSANAVLQGPSRGGQTSVQMNDDMMLPEELEGNTELPEQRAEDLFEWEKLKCDPPYHLQGDESFESPHRLAERQALKAHPEVEAALEHIWGLFPKDEQDRVTKREYARVLLRICLVLVPELRGRQVVELIEEEWQQDSKGEETLSRPAFFDSFFQLADIWTPGIDGSAYAEFLTRLFRRITVKKVYTTSAVKATKIRPKIVVKVLNKDIQKPGDRQPDQEDTQQVDLVVDRGSAATCVAEWSKAEHEAVEALVVAHISGEKKELESLELHEEVLHDCSDVSPKEPVSTEWADFASIAPMGAASRAFLESVFSKSLATILQAQQQQQLEQEAPSIPQAVQRLPMPLDEEEQKEEGPPAEVTEEPSRPSLQPVVRRHLAAYQSKSDLPLRVTGISEEELRPFNSLGLPVQVEGMQKLIRLKEAPPLMLQCQIENEERYDAQQRHEAASEALPSAEENMSIYQIEDSQATLFRDLHPFDGEEPPLDELKKALSSGEEVRTSPRPLPSQSELEPPISPDLESKNEPEPEPEPKPQQEPQPEPEAEQEKTAQADQQDETTGDAHLETDPSGCDTNEVPAPSAEVGEPPAVEHTVSPAAAETTTISPPFAALRRPPHFRARVFHSLREESLRQIRAKSFRRSIIVSGVGTVAVRRRSDFEDGLLRRNLPVAEESGE